MEDVLIIHYAEIGIKGRNRSHFENQLREDIQRRLVPAHLTGVHLESGRFVGKLADRAERDFIRAEMKKVFGVAWYAFAVRTAPECAAIEQAALEQAKAHSQAKTFRITAKRADKHFPMSSQEIAIQLGAAVNKETGLDVNLEAADLDIQVTITSESALIFSDKVPGVRGMPARSAGKMVCLFSGGIDSPVAAWQMMRRGAGITLLHFHPYSRNDQVLETKIPRLHDALKEFDPKCRLFLAPHYVYEARSSLDVSPAEGMVVFRRFIFLVGEKLAASLKMKGMISGDSLGQVASQTLGNLHAAQYDLSIPLFRPLIAMDKDDIIRIARDIGTYEPSIEAYKDCCSLVGRKPNTNVSQNYVRKLEKRIDMDSIVNETLELIEERVGDTLYRRGGEIVGDSTDEGGEPRLTDS